MSSPNENTNENKAQKQALWGYRRKFLILLIILVWVVCYFWKYEEMDNRAFWVFGGLIATYISDLLYSIILSAKASELFKSFMFQTAIPISALTLVSLLAYKGSIDSSTTLTLFGLSLGYTTYVVGKKIKNDDENNVENSEAS